MITPDEIREKAERLFPKAISAWLAAEDDFFPRRLAVDLRVKGKSHAQLIQVVNQLRERFNFEGAPIRIKNRLSRKTKKR